jgi:hypothetical protein
MPKSKKQKLYKMRGCSKKNKSRKHWGGANMNLAYTGQPIFSLPNPHLAYTGSTSNSASSKTGGSNTSNTNSSNMRVNTNAENPVYPNTGGPPAHQGWINSSTQRGGSCGGTCGLLKGGSCGLLKGGSCGLLKGGSCGGTCGLLKGGGKHRTGCRCTTCKGKRQKGGNNGLPYGQGLAQMNPILAPSGLTGSSWSADFGWPGTNSIGGDHNHYSLNKYAPVDISRQMQDIGAQPPFLGMVGGKRKNKSRKQRGGALSNFLYEDLVNVGRQVQFGLGSTYNALSGYSAPVNPMPWNQPGLSSPSVFRQ